MLHDHNEWQPSSEEPAEVLPGDAGFQDITGTRQACRFRAIAVLQRLAETRHLCERAFTATRQALRPDRRTFLKDMALLGLGGFALYDRVRQGRQHAVAASPALKDEPAVAAPENIPFEFVSPLLSFTLPIMGFSLKTLPASRLPNAPRAYRQGRHEGIDLYGPFGTKVFAVADGIVTRADEHFRELDPGLHRLYLAESGDLRVTPPDILGYLHGRRVEIDHGLREGVRWRSVYSHLSQVLVTPGIRITQGEPIGAVGNSGTTAGVRGTREDTHLHLEIRSQVAGSREMYLGEGLSERQVRLLLEELFHA